MTVITWMHFANAQGIQQQISDLVATYAELGKFNGSILVASNDGILLEKGYGYKDFKKKSPNDASTIYQIASVTKTFTSTLVLKLVELKQLSLVDKLSRFYPGFPKGDSVTIEHLLTHTSGISDDFSDTSYRIYKGSPEEVFIAVLAKRNYDFSPGAGWNYSNSGYILLGYVIQKITGMNYFDAVRAYIFKPLQMNQSGFDFVGLSNPDKATGYWAFPENDSVSPATLIDSSAPRAAGAIYSTVHDLYKWHLGLQTGKILSLPMLNKAYTAVKNNYGYGWIVDSFARAKVVSHSGDIWGFKSEFARVPHDNICITMLNNIEEVDLRIITRKILAILYHQPYQLPAKNKIQLGGTILQKYVGGYVIRPGEIISVSAENGHLMATTDRKQELYAQGEDLFLIDDGNEQKDIRFEKDSSGKVIALSFQNRGKKIICKKVN